MREAQRTTQKCEYCGETFQQTRSDQRYCSTRCRVAGNRAIRIIHYCYNARLKEQLQSRDTEPLRVEPTKEELQQLIDDMALLVPPHMFTGLGQFGGHLMKQDYAALKKALASLSKTAAEKTLRVFLKLLEYHGEIFRLELDRLLPGHIKEAQEKLKADRKKLKEDFEKQVRRTAGMRARLTDTELKLIQGELHPDKLPTDATDAQFKRRIKAFDAFRKAC